jgi:hypothetical protein
LLLFGGWRWENGQRVRLGDLWEWDGNIWRQGLTGPPPRSGAAMAFDPVRRRMLLVGGNGARQDCWSYDGNEWQQEPDLPQGRFNPLMGWDVPRRQFLLFGGWTGSDRLAATIALAGGSWKSQDGPGPCARNHSLLVPDFDGNHLLLIGGHTGDAVLGDLWRWDGIWQNLVATPPRLRVENHH